MNNKIVLTKRDMALGIVCLLLFLGIMYQGVGVSSPDKRQAISS